MAAREAESLPARHPSAPAIALAAAGPGVATVGATAVSPTEAMTATSGADPEAQPRNRPERETIGRRLLIIAGVLVPLGVLTYWAAHLVPGFDGAMNLQVAENLADGDGYVRLYGGRTVFPHEVETSGPFVFLAAAVIKLFGLSYFTLQAANLVFLAVLLTGISVALRPWLLARVLAPSLVLICVPGMTGLAAGGIGEFPVAGVQLWALILLASVVMGASRPVLRMIGCAVLLGIAITIKLVAIAVLPVAALGLVLALVTRRDTARWKLVAAPLALLLPIGAYELYRLRALESWQQYWAFWTDQSTRVVAQAGLEPATVPVSRLQKGADHMHLLAQQTGIPAEALVLALVVPGVLLALAFLLRGTGWREWLAAPGRALAVLLTSYGYLYFVWWLFITPTEKAWLRRIIIAIVLLGVVYALLSGMGVDRLRRLRAERTGTRWAVGGVFSVAVVALIAVAIASVPVARTNLRALLVTSDAGQDSVTRAVEQIEQFDADGKELFGGGWWSAPVLSLVSDVPFGDITELDPCSPADAALLGSGDAVFVWDRYGMSISGPAPVQNAFEFELISQPSDSAGFWALSFAADACQS